MDSPTRPNWEVIEVVETLFRERKNRPETGSVVVNCDDAIGVFCQSPVGQVGDGDAA